MSNVTKTKRSRKPPVSSITVDDGLQDRSLLSRRPHAQQSAGSGEKIPSRKRQRHGLLMGCMVTLAQGSLIFMGAILTYSAVNFTKHANFLSSTKDLSPDRRSVKLHIPSGLDQTSRRSLSLDIGGGNCKWQVRDQLVHSSLMCYFTRN